MSRVEQAKLRVLTGLERFRPLLRVLRALPLPSALQRITGRGLELLKRRIPELAYLLGGPMKAPKQRSSGSPNRTAQDLSELLAELQTRDYATRLGAVQALAGRREPEAVSALIAALRDRSVEVAVGAATSLSVGGGEVARGALQQVLENAEGYFHPLTRAAAVHGLGTLLGDEAEQGPLFFALRDIHAEVSIAAIAALAALGTERATMSLLEVVENAEGYFLPITRLAAARALERATLAPRASLERLTMQEQDGTIAEALTRALRRTPSEPGVNASS
jgi:HEAT repeat protein